MQLFYIFLWKVSSLKLIILTPLNIDNMSDVHCVYVPNKVVIILYTISAKSTVHYSQTVVNLCMPNAVGKRRDDNCC